MRRALLLCACTLALWAQSNPTPFDLSSGNYSLTAWDPNSPAGTYPPNMYFHRSNVQDPQLTDEMTADYTGAYNLTSGTRINGLGTDGFSFLNTATNGNLGAAVLALNTTGRVNIQVSWVGGTVATGAREYRIRLQYRIGTTGSFSDVLVGGQPVEYIASGTAGHSQSFGPITLPAAVENQPVVQLRWKYYYVPGVTGTRPQLRVDDILVTSTPAVGLPTRLSITEILPATPSANTPFTVTVRAEDDNGTPRNVTQATTVALSVAAGTGTLGGTTSGVIPAGANTVTISGVTYSVAESGVRLRASTTAGMSLASAVSAPFTVMPAATHLAITAAPSSGYTIVPLPPLTVQARRPDGTVDPNYPYAITVSKVSGPGTLSGTLSKLPSSGVASFTDLSVDQPGTYVLQVSAPGLTSAQTAPFTVLPVPQMSELIVPRYMKSLSTTLRVPVWALVELSDLQPNTTYRYFAGGDTAPTTTGIGAGITVFYDALADSFYYNSLRSLTTPGQYSVLRTGPGQTRARVWLNLVPSTNVRFTEGNSIYWLLVLGDSVGNQIRRFSGTLPMRTLDFGSEPTRATGVYDRNSCLQPRQILCLYDDVEGSGRPVATAMVQNEGVQLPGGAPFYAAVDSIPGGWATLIPNTLPNGIRRIEVRSFQDGELIGYWTSPDGTWSGTSTVNPSGGSAAPIALTTPCLQLLEPVAGAEWCAGVVQEIRWTARGVDRVRLELSRDGGQSWELIAAGIPAADGRFAWSVPDTHNLGMRYQVRIVNEAHPWHADTSGVFALNEPPRVRVQPQSVVACVGEPIRLELFATGTGLRYQWYKDGVELQGATAPVLSFAEASYELSGGYVCVVSGVGTCPPETTQVAYVYVVGPTRIVRQPNDVVVPYGGTALLEVEAHVVQGQYQWRRDGVALRDDGRIIGANSSVLTIRQVTEEDAQGRYDVVVRGRCGVDSSVAVRIIIPRIAFVEQPRSQDVCAGGVLRLRGMVATSPPTLGVRYQWLRNGVPLEDGGRISGARAEELVITPVLPGDSGAYELEARVQETGESVRSQPAVVDVLEPPVVTAEAPAYRERLCRGGTATLYGSNWVESELQRGGVRGKKLRYYWMHNGAMVGEGGELQVVASDSSAFGEYWLVLANDCGADSVLYWVLEGFLPETRILQQPPRRLGVLQGTTVELSVVATGAGTLEYRWYHNGQQLPVPSLPTLTLSSVRLADSGAYYCYVLGACGGVYSDTTWLEVEPQSVAEHSTEGISLRLQPQPARDRVWVEAQVAQPGSWLRLYSALGELLWEQPLHGARQFELELSPYAAGVYWIAVEAPNGRLARPLWIVR